MSFKEAGPRSHSAFDGLVPDWGPHIETGLGISALHRRGPDSINFIAPVHVAVLLLTPQPAREVSLATSRKSQFDAPVGTMEVMPAGADFFGRWAVAKENLFFAYHPEKLASLALQEFSVDKLEIHPPKPGSVDVQMLAIAGLLRHEFSTGDAVSALCIDTLNLLFAMNLLRNHSNVRGYALADGARVKGGLPAFTRRAVVDYMNDRIGAALGIEELAAVAGLSPGHFLRSFKRSFGETPHRYLMKLRLDLAERLTIEGDLPLSLIAQIAGFASQSHMTAEMKRQRGNTPSALRQLVRTTRTVSS